MTAVEAVRADDGSSAIDALGADKADCEACRNILLDVLDKLPVWKQRGLQRHGAGRDIDSDDEADTADEADGDVEVYDDLDLDDNGDDQQDELMT